MAPGSFLNITFITLSSDKEQIMPNGDQTGPLGAGAMTGRQRGYCAGFQQPGCADHGFGYGGGRRRRRGFAGAVRFPAPPASPLDTKAIAGRMDQLQRELNHLRTQIEAGGSDDA